MASQPWTDDDDMIVMVATFLLMDSSSDEEAEQVPRLPRQPQRTLSVDGQAYMNHLLDGNPHTIHALLRVDAETFRSLAQLFLARGGLNWEHKRLSVEVSLGIFLYIVAGNRGMRDAAEKFQCSTDTVHRHFKYMLRGLCNIAPLVIHPPDMNDVPQYISNNDRYFPWFQNCVGAIDGTHVDLHVAASHSGVYRTRKGTIAQNVLAVCSFDGKFTFMYPGWEGSAHDSRVLVAGATGEGHNFPHPPAGKYYLDDAGYTNTIGFLALYRGQRYHRDEYDGANTVYDSAQDLFNHRHAMLRNTIEKCFGVLKARFHILNGVPKYKPARQTLVVTACCVVHNWIKMQNGWDEIFEQLMEGGQDREALLGIGNLPFDMSPAAIQAMTNVRDGIANAMWEDYVNGD